MTQKCLRNYGKYDQNDARKPTQQIRVSDENEISRNFNFGNFRMHTRS